jgi:class 3 adenylate cyclase
MRDRLVKRFDQLQDKLDEVAMGRVMPVIEDLKLGTGRQQHLAIMFLDICDFSDRLNWTAEEQKQVLADLNLFISEMITLVRENDGHFEKNTGDGLMAYFGEACPTDTERVGLAVEAALYMHYFNDHMLTPHLASRGLPPIRFRVGIDVGLVTLARIGIKSTSSNYNSIVAIGTPANAACKLMKLVPNGGICVGENTYHQFPQNWAGRSAISKELTGFVYRDSEQPYPGWVVNYRLREPSR